GVGSELRIGTRRGVNGGRLVQIAADLVDNADHIQSLGYRRGRADDVCRRYRRLENVQCRTPVSLFQISATQPSQGSQSGTGIGARIPDQGLIDAAGVRPASFPLGVLRAIDVFSDGG